MRTIFQNSLIPTPRIDSRMRIEHLLTVVICYDNNYKLKSNTKFMNIKNILIGSIAMVGVGVAYTLFDKYVELPDHHKPAIYWDAEVLKESGNTKLKESSGALFGNESVKIRTDYVLTLKRKDNNQTYFLKVNEVRKPLSALEASIDEGDIIRVVERKSDDDYRESGNDSRDVYHMNSDKIGDIDSDHIILVGKKKPALVERP